MFLVVTNTREHLLRCFALLRLTEALPLTMAESLPEISREQADILLRQIHAALGTPRAGDRDRSGHGWRVPVGGEGEGQKKTS